MIKMSIHQENIVILNEYVLNQKAIKYGKQNLAKLIEEIDKSAIVRDNNTHPFNNEKKN